MKLFIIIFILVGILIWRYWRNCRHPSDETTADDLISRLAATGILVAYFYLDLLPAFRHGGKSVGYAMLVTALVCLLLFWLWGRAALNVLISPITGLFDGGNMRPEDRPFYSVAEARRKQGRPGEAIAEVRQQLARFPEDFDGQMLLAEIQAEDLNDFPAARATLEALLDQKNQPAYKKAFALNTLADWHLKFAQDTTAARIALERIPKLAPDSELAQKASQRLAHLPSREDLLARKERSRVALPHYDEYLKPGETLQQRQPSVETDPAAQAEALVRRLQEFPQDDEAREKLALVYARHYRRLDLAMEQLEQLIAQPAAPARHVTHWLILMASLQLDLAGDRTAACQAYQRIVDRYPRTPAADAAGQQIAQLGGMPRM